MELTPELKESVLRTSAHNWRPYVGLNDEQLAVQYNKIMNVNNLLYFLMLVGPVLMPFFLRWAIDSVRPDMILPMRMVIYLPAMLTIALTFFYIARGNEETLSHLLPLTTQSRLYYQYERMKKQSVLFAEWEEEALAQGRTLRVFDYEIMQALKEVSDYYSQVEREKVQKKFTVLRNKTMQGTVQ